MRVQWEVFRCQTNCTAYPTTCINQDLYMAQTVGSLFLCATWPSSQRAFPTSREAVGTLDPSPPAHGAASSQDALVSGGYLAAGYSSIHIDDCWMETSPPRNAQGQLQVRHEAPASPGFSYNQLSKQRVWSLLWTPCEAATPCVSLRCGPCD
jgi:hypothetical protein